MVQEIHIHPGGAIVKDVAEFARPAGIDRQRIGTEQREIADQESGRRAGRTTENSRHKEFRMVSVMEDGRPARLCSGSMPDGRGTPRPAIRISFDFTGSPASGLRGLVYND